MSWSLSAAKNLIARCGELRKQGRSEAVLRAEFQSWLRQVFPDPEDEAWVNHYSEGAEAHTKIGITGGSTSSRFIDNLIRSTVIEYEADLRKTALREHGRDQVREYIAGTVRAGTSISQARGVLSDTVEWHVFDATLAPEIRPEACTKSDITLHEIDSFEPDAANDENASRLAAFIKKHLAREQSRALTAENIAGDLGFESLPFGRHVDTLLSLINNGRKNDSSIALATDLWSQFVDGLERAHLGFRADMYVDEAYVAVLARLLGANVLENKAILSDDTGLSEILTGEYFATKFRLKNMVEDDYFGWLLRDPYLTNLMPVAREMQRDLYAYDFSNLKEQDLFGRLMTQLARRSQRKLLGQEWTPSWLARQLAIRCLASIPEGENPQIVDMCCGSGSILAEVLTEQVRRHPGIQLDDIVNVATGFDIDPLAVMLAKTTWVITLASRLQKASTDVVIPIYHADSLFAATPNSTMPGPGETADIPVQLDGETVLLPAELIHPELRVLFDDIIDWAYDEAKYAAKDPGRELIQDQADRLIQGLKEKHSLTIGAPLKSRIALATLQLAKRMAYLARQKRNGIWAFILRNTYRPGLLVGQFNGLVSNPPWLAMSQLANNPYKEQLSKRSLLYGIKPSGASHLHLELATTYLIHAIDRYLKVGASVACLVPGTVFKGHHQQKFRDAAYLTGPRPVSFERKEVWEVELGTFKVRSAAVIGVKMDQANKVRESIAGFEVGPGGLSKRGFTVLRRDKRTAWLLGTAPSSMGSSTSEPVPPQGADLMPRTAVCVEIVERKGSEWRVKTPGVGSPFHFAVKDAKQLKGKKFDGFVAPRFIFRMVQSLNLLPFVCVEPFVSIALPAIRMGSGALKVLTVSEIRTLGLRNTANRFQNINDTISKSKAGKPLEIRIDERNKLTMQTFAKDHYLVLSGAGGGIACGAFLPVKSAERTVIDQTLYWRIVPTRMEALYRVGLLNSDALTEAVRFFNPEGEFGARHPHTLPHRFIPAFNTKDGTHLQIAQLAETVAKKAEEIITKQKGVADPSKSIASRRRKLRQLLHQSPEFKKLEAACTAALKAAATRKT